MPAILGHIPSESERMTRRELLSLPSARLTDKLPAEIRYDIDRRIAAAALTQMLKGWHVPNFQRVKSGAFSRYALKLLASLRYKEFIHRILERLDMPAHELEPKPKRKLPLWAEALDLLQSESASELFDHYRHLPERDDDYWPSLAEIKRLYGSDYRSSARATSRAARIFWFDAVLAELQRLHQVVDRL